MNRDDLIILFCDKIWNAVLKNVSEDGAPPVVSEIHKLLRQFADAMDRERELCQRRNRGFITPTLKNK